MRIDSRGAGAIAAHKFVVSCRELEFAYKPGEDILKGVTFDLPVGALGVVFGRSGVGKTTLLRCLTGYVEPTGGSIEWPQAAYGVDPSVPSTADESGRVRDLVTLWKRLEAGRSAKRSGLRLEALYANRNPAVLVFADCANALPQLSVEENLRLVLAPVCKDESNLNGMIALLLAITHLSEVRLHTPAELSSGQLRRLCLAQSLAVRPRLLVWDEPTSGLDSGTKYRFVHFIQSLRAAVQVPGLMVTHDVETALMLADEIYLFDEGRINTTLPVHIPQPRFPQDLDSAEYRPLRLEMLRFLGAGAFQEGVL